MLRNIWFSGLLASCVLISTAAFSNDLADLDTAHPKAATAVVYRDENGAVHTLDFKANKLTAVHFWAIWCTPCIKELPEVNAAQAAYGSKGFKVLTLSLGGEVPKIKQFFANHAIAHLPAYIDSNSFSFKNAEFRGLPSTLFIDANGKEVARAEGPLDWKKPDVVTLIESNLK